MTISSTTVRNSYNGDGSTTTFNYTFKIFADSDLQVIIRNNTTATETVKTLTTHYTVTGAGSASGGSVIFTAGNIPASGETVVLRRAVPQTQAIDYIANDPFPAESHEEGLDRAMMTLQQLQEEVTRSIKLSRTNTITSTEFTAGSSDRANKVLAFDSSGEIAVTQEIGVFKGNWSAGETYAVRDIVKDTTNNNIYIANTAHTSSGSLPISSNADSAKWNLIVDAASATASASAAATSATNAANSATAAASSASAASTSETNANNYQLSAFASSSQAFFHASNAEGYKNQAEAAFDSFDDRYLGAKASDPTLDNDGNALIDGALYFDTTNNVMKVYDLGGTAWRRTTPTTAEQTNINTVSTNIASVNTAATNIANVNTVGSISSDVTTVAGINTEVVAVAGDATDIGTVASNIGNVTAVGNDLSNNFSYIEDNGSIVDAVTSTAGTSLIETVANDIANVNIVGGISSDVTTVAGIDTEVVAVSGDASDIGLVASNIGSVSAVGSDLANNFSHIEDNGSITSAVTSTSGISLVKEVADDIVNVNLVGGSIGNVNLVGGSIANVNTVGSNIGTVNEFAQRYRVASADPTTSLDEGDLAYNTTANVLKYYDGTTWNPVVAGALTDVVQDGTPQLGGDLDGQNNNLNNIGTIDGTNLQIDFGGL